MGKQLVHKMYADKDGFRNRGLFGLYYGNETKNDFVHNGRWYNGAGEFLGWGDLSVLDIHKISQEIEAGETFIVVRENDDWDCDADRKQVEDTARYAITRGAIFLVARENKSDEPLGEVIMYGDLRCKVISNDELKQLMD